jgi:hypothetical protein
MPMTRMVAVLVVVLIGWGGVVAATIQSSERCGQCHQGIFETWADSAHASSLEEPFLGVYYDMLDSGQKKEARVCLGCHAPIIDMNDDDDLELRVTWEGINCEVCHSLVSVDLSGKGPRTVLEPGRVKRGPVPDAAETPAHDVAYSELHTTSLACAWCHEYSNPEGTPILTTYTEWRQSSAAERGQTCQGCHMGRTAVAVADPRSEREELAPVNMHQVPGGHSLEQLHRAFAVAVVPRRAGDELVVEIQLRNKGAGHAVPTGMPGRRVILDVDVRTSDGAQFKEHETYGKFFVDAAGNRITRDSGYFARGVELESDTRIRPDETRTEVYRFPVAARATAYVTVRLHYEHAPTGGEEGRTWITFLSEKRTLVPAP